MLHSKSVAHIPAAQESNPADKQTPESNLRVLCVLPAKANLQGMDPLD